MSIICKPEVEAPMVEDELKTMHTVPKKLKSIGGTLSLEEVAAAVLRGLGAGRSVIIPGTKAKITYLCNRYLPDFVMNTFVDRVVCSELSKM